MFVGTYLVFATSSSSLSLPNALDWEIGHRWRRCAPFPLSLLPLLFVPLIIASHVLIFVRL
jgi:hypothetical protein